MVPSVRTRRAARVPSALAFAAALGLTFAAAVGTNIQGADFEWETSPALDAFVRGDFHALGTNFPLMGPVSLIVRVPFDWLVNSADIRVVYLVTSLPCMLAFGLALAWLKRLLRSRQSSVMATAIVVLVGVNTAVVRSIHWGHPEDLLAVALLLTAALAASRLHWTVTAVMLGLAFATKQWTLLGLVPVVLAASERRAALAATAVALAVLVTLPFAVQAPQRFKDIALATSNTEAFWHRGEEADGVSRVTPANVVWPFAKRRHEYRSGLRVESAVVPNGTVRVMHILVGLVVLPLCWLGWRARKRAGPDTWLGVLAAIFLFRCLLDPVNFDYYQLTGVVFLGAWEGMTRPGVPALTSLAVIGMGITWAAHANTFASLFQHSLWMNVTYLSWMTLLLLVLLSRQLSASRE